MLDMIQTVLGAVATKDILPVLTHIHVTPTGVQGSNGRISIHYPGSPPVDRNVCLPGRKLQQALKRGKEPKWTFTDISLTLTAGKLRVRLPISPAPYPTTEPSSGPAHTLHDPEEFLHALTVLRPFMARDGSRPWACGILVAPGAMYATNNVVLLRFRWAGAATNLPPANIPVDAVEEVLRLAKAGHTPNTLLADDTSLTVLFDTGVWLRTTLLSNQWPDADTMVDAVPVSPSYPGILAELREGVEAVVPFSADERAPVVELGDFGMRTRDGDVQASMDLVGLPEGSYRAEVLALVLTVADQVYFDEYPAPVHFTGAGGKVRGLFAGVRS